MSGEGSLFLISNLSQTSVFVKYRVTCLGVVAMPDCCKGPETSALDFRGWGRLEKEQRRGQGGTASRAWRSGHARRAFPYGLCVC